MNKGRYNICLMVTGLNRAGAETQMSRIALGLRERGYRITVISLIEPTHFVAELNEAGIEVISLHVAAGKMDPRLMTRAVKHLKRIKPDLLLSFMFHANLLGRIAGKIAGVKCIVGSVRGERFGQRGWSRETLKARLRGWGLRLTDSLGCAMTTNSAVVAKHLVQDRIVSASRLHVIPNIALLETGESVAQVSRTDLGVSDDAFLFLNVARLNPVKDQATLLRAFAQVDSPENRPIHLAIAGGGSLESELNMLAEGLGIAGRIHFLGERQDVPHLYKLADAAVLSSVSEGLPNVLIEAHCAGLPVVATDVGGVSEIVSDGESGFLVPASSVDALAEAMMKLIGLTDDVRRKMGQTGQLHVQKQFDREQVLNRWEALCDRLLHPSSSS